MKTFCNNLEIFNPFAILFIFLLPCSSPAQEVSTFVDITANGGISVDHEGNLFMAHFGPLPPNPSIGKDIYKITPAGEITLFVDGQLDVGSGNSIDSQGNLFQSNFSTGKIFKIDPTGTTIDFNFATISGPVGITTGENDTLYICACGTNEVKKVSPDGNVLPFASGLFFNCANGITTDHEGNIYTTNFSDGRITKITPEGSIETLGTSSTFGNGHITYRHIDQMFYIASYGGHRIYRMDLSGNAELFAGTGSAGSEDSTDPLLATFNKPNGIEISPDGCSLYISQDDDVLREIKFADAECLSKIEQLEFLPDLKMYPNPASEKIMFENKSNLNITSITITNSQGKRVRIIKSDYIKEIDISNLATGIYSFLIELKTGRRFVNQVIIK